MWNSWEGRKIRQYEDTSWILILPFWCSTSTTIHWKLMLQVKLRHIFEKLPQPQLDSLRPQNKAQEDVKREYVSSLSDSSHCLCSNHRWFCGQDGGCGFFCVQSRPFLCIPQNLIFCILYWDGSQGSHLKLNSWSVSERLAIPECLSPQYVNPCVQWRSYQWYDYPLWHIPPP